MSAERRGGCPWRGGAPITALTFGGGRIFERGHGARVASANLTPDPSGIAYYDEAMFREVLHTCKVGGRDLNDSMPSAFFEGLTDLDLSAIFAFLQTVAPVAHEVSNIDDPTPCPRCGQTHGLGEDNEALPAAP